MNLQWEGMQANALILIFLYDYDGNLVKIVDLGIPVMRIASEEQSNTLYAIGVNPDFVLVKYEL